MRETGPVSLFDSLVTAVLPTETLEQAPRDFSIQQCDSPKGTPPLGLLSKRLPQLPSAV
jgi:hypothetical protein